VITSRDGTQISWHQAGEGPPTVLVHGSCGDKGNWIRCTPLLAGRLSLYAVDRRGRGRSGDGTEYAIQREYEDLAAVIAAIGEPITLIGHSYGAIVSLGALSLIDRVRRLVLYEPPLLAARFHDCEQWATQIESHIQASDRAAAAETFLQRAASAEEIAQLRAFPPAWNQIERDVHTVPREIRSLTSMWCTRFDDIALPVLLLFGARSETYLRASVKHLASMLPAARTAEIPDQGHLAQAFAPELFCTQVLRFIDNPTV